MKKMVLFDCDGVLVNTEEIGYYIISAMLAEKDIHYSRNEYVELLSGVTYEEFKNRLRTAHPEKIDDAFFAEMSRRTQHAEDTQMKAIDGVKELLEKLEENNIAFAVCSNSESANLIGKLKKAGLYDYFRPHIYSRDHVDNPKPAPDMFEMAAADRGIAPKDCLVVEDSMTGTQAGVAAGMTVIGFVGENHREDGEAQMLMDAGAKMIALNPEQVWDHIADQNGIKPGLFFWGPDLQL